MRPDMLKAAMHDATVAAHIHTWQKLGGVGYTEMLEGLVLALAKEKKAYLDMATEATSMRPPTPMLIPGGLAKANLIPIEEGKTDAKRN